MKTIRVLHVLYGMKLEIKRLGVSEIVLKHKKLRRKKMNLKEAINRIDSTSVIEAITDEQRKEIQSKLLEMYSDLFCVCQRYGIVPYLGGGSCLGAVRHQGFIPWDDDLDVNITREDYEKLKNVFDAELSSKYILVAPNYSSVSISRFPKMLMKGTKLVEIGGPKREDYQCLSIDLFVIENVPENKFLRMLKGTYANILEYIAGRVQMYQDSDELSNKLMKLTGNRYYFDKMVGAVFSFRDVSFWNNYVDKVVQYKKHTSLCNFPTGRKHYFGEILEKNELFPEVLVDFENIKAPIFKGYDYYLTNLYGEYMDIPSVENREKHFIKEVKL